MNRRELLAGAGTLLGASAASSMGLPAAPHGRDILVIGHRGASALRPEHTLASYAKAIEDGADFIEPDLCMTKDGSLIVRHENNIADTTNVASRPEFADRKTVKTIDGMNQTGWFTEDFTLAELKSLRAKERLGQLRPANAVMDGWFDLVTFEETIDFALAESLARGRPIGLIPELKHPSYFGGIGLPMEDRVIKSLRDHRQTRIGPVIIQCMESQPLRNLRRELGRPQNIQLLQLCMRVPEPMPASLPSGTRPFYEEMLRMSKPAGVADVASYADILAPELRTAIPLLADQSLGRPSDLIKAAKDAGLKIIPWTFRPENQFLAANFRTGSDPNARNAPGSIAEIRAYLAMGIDGFFTDDPAIGRQAVLGS